MHPTRIAKVLLAACLLFASFRSRAQDAESIRARNFMALQRLLSLQAMAPYYLTTADLAEIRTLQGQTQTEICQAVTIANCQPTILPITGLKLTGQRTSNEKVQLAWETLAEYNSKGFVLERQSVLNALQYDSLVFVRGAGTRYSKSKYSYSDFNNYKGASFYRIKQVDNDEKLTYSNVVMIEGYSGKFDMNVAPNPATGHTVRVYFKGLDASQNISLTVSSAIGKQLIQKDDFKPGSGYVELNSPLFASGYYFVTVYTNGGVYTKSFSIVD